MTKTVGLLYLVIFVRGKDGDVRHKVDVIKKELFPCIAAMS
jgi:hypothetical protein